jgi:hypothetical protein
MCRRLPDGRLSALTTASRSSWQATRQELFIEPLEGDVLGSCGADSFPVMPGLRSFRGEIVTSSHRYYSCCFPVVLGPGWVEPLSSELLTPISGSGGRRRCPRRRRHTPGRGHLDRLLQARIPSRSLRMRKDSLGACSLSAAGAGYRLGSDRGSPNHGSTMLSKRVMAQIRSPARVST